MTRDLIDLDLTRQNLTLNSLTFYFVKTMLFGSEPYPKSKSD
jgi:hypothetical protein